MDLSIDFDDKKDLLKYTLPDIKRGIHHDFGLYINSYWRKKVHPSKNLEPRYFTFYCISHLLDGIGYYWTPKRHPQIFKPGDAVISTPGFIQDYHGHDGHNYVEDSICFSGPLADAYFKNEIIKNGVIRIGESRRLLPIILTSLDPRDTSQIKANLDLQQLLLELYFENRSDSARGVSNGMEKLTENIKNNIRKFWTVPEMADFCNLSESRFRPLFKKYSGMSPKRFVDECKMKEATEMLVNSDRNVAQIASLIGYDDPYHFSRRFKEITGYTPTSIRIKATRHLIP